MRPSHGADQLIGAPPHDGVTGTPVGLLVYYIPSETGVANLGYLELSALESTCRMALLLYTWLKQAINETQSLSGADMPLWHLYWQNDLRGEFFIVHCGAGRIKIGFPLS